ncbi:MAG: hypothetical protein D6795_13400 [Deltaproteobacteria bacterium]|nr:MAG: hypothetical protein D6795_13400 [Deltaproteobacteria bacterium]
MWAQIARGGGEWVGRLWRETPPSLALVKSIEAFTPGGAVPGYVRVTAVPSGWLGDVAFVILLLLFLRGGRHALRHPRGRVVLLLLSGMLLLPWLVSFVKPVYLVGRYDLAALSAFFLVVGYGFARGGGRGWGRCVKWVAFLLLAVSGMTGIWRLHTLPPLSEARTQAAFIRRIANPETIVVATGFSRNPVEYLLRDTPISFRSYPRSTGKHRGWVDPRDLSDSERLRSDAEIVGREIVGHEVVLLHAAGFTRANLPLYRQIEARCSEITLGPPPPRGISRWRCR